VPVIRHNPRQCACRGRAADHSADIGSKLNTENRATPSGATYPMAATTNRANREPVAAVRPLGRTRQQVAANRTGGNPECIVVLLTGALRGDGMHWTHRHGRRLFPRPGRRITFSDSADYWPLTIVPSRSTPKRSMRAWVVVSALLALGAAVAIARQRGIPAW
jgi:hypothetical protein